MDEKTLHLMMTGFQTMFTNLQSALHVQTPHFELTSIRETLVSIDENLLNIQVGFDKVANAVSSGLHTEAMRLLQSENAQLMAELTERDIKLSKLAVLLRDLSGPCLGCKKAEWRPHEEACAWSSANEQLKQMFLKE